jgi:hypothetical protein
LLQSKERLGTTEMAGGQMSVTVQVEPAQIPLIS